MSTTQNTKLFIDGKWRHSSDGGVIDVINPATEDVVGTVAKATLDDLNDALLAAEKGFEIWKTTSPFDRYKILRRAADLLRPTCRCQQEAALNGTSRWQRAGRGPRGARHLA